MCVRVCKMTQKRQQNYQCLITKSTYQQRIKITRRSHINSAVNHISVSIFISTEHTRSHQLEYINGQWVKITSSSIQQQCIKTTSTSAYAHTHTHAHTHTRTHTHIHTHTPGGTHTHQVAPTHPHTQPPTHPHTHTHTHLRAMELKKRFKKREKFLRKS